LLSAGWDAFELVRTVTGVSADRSADMYPAFTFARGEAVSGRNAIAFAPSMPRGHTVPPGDPVLIAGDVDEIADVVAVLASTLSACLRGAAGLATDAGDHAACENAARHADQICQLLARGQ
jgi:hypothetical protein